MSIMDGCKDNLKQISETEFSIPDALLLEFQNNYKVAVGKSISKIEAREKFYDIFILVCALIEPYLGDLTLETEHIENISR